MFRPAALLLPLACFGQSTLMLRVWETCSAGENNEGECRPSDQPRPFAEFLVPGAWTSTPGDFFSDEFQDLVETYKPAKVTWKELGRFGSHRIRHITYGVDDSSFADLILAESNPGIFSPPLKWYGPALGPKTYNHNGIQVVAAAKRFGGKFGVFAMWAWIWRADGPVRLDVNAALSQAVAKVAPGLPGTPIELDLEALRGLTGLWTADKSGRVVGRSRRSLVRASRGWSGSYSS